MAKHLAGRYRRMSRTIWRVNVTPPPVTKGIVPLTSIVIFKVWLDILENRMFTSDLSMDQTTIQLDDS